MARAGWLIAAHIAVACLLTLLPRVGFAQTYDDEGAAYAACVPVAAAAVASSPNTRRNPICRKKDASGTNTPKAYWACFNSRPSSTVEWTNGIGCTRSFSFRDSCASRPAYTGVGPWSSGGGSARNGSLGCQNGCDGVWYSNADNSMTFNVTGDLCPDDEKSNCEHMPDGYYWNAALNVCEPPEGKCPLGRSPNSLGKCEPEPCPPGKIMQADGTCKNKDNECPAGQIKSPDGKCLPGDGQCAQGEVRGKDGTCKKDSDGDGNPDEGEEGGEGSDGKKKDEFSGGDDCKTPPTCSGSPIMCGQARIQWRIDCNTRKNRNVAGGTCNTTPVCTGEKCDAVEYAGLLMQWRTACATEKLAQGNNGNGGAQPEWTKVTGMSTDPGAGSSPDDLKVLTTKTISVSDLDQSGIGGGGSCMGFASGGSNGITSGFMSAIATPPAFFCQYIAQIKALIITIAAVAAAVILARGGN